MANPTDWETKYRHIIDELELKEETWAKLESLLRKAIGRLTFVGMGIDHSLDAPLHDIKHSSQHKEDEKLSDALDQLTDVLSHIDANDAKHNPVKDELNTLNTVMTQLLSLLTPPEQYQPSLERVKAQLPADKPEDILMELADELNQIMLAHESFGIDQANIEDVILNLLERLSIVPGMSSKGKTIQQSIKQGIGDTQWLKILDDIAVEVGTAVKHFKQEKNDIQSFIDQSSQQINEISKLISNEIAAQKIENSNARDSNFQINEAILYMAKALETSTDLNDLKQNLGEQLNALTENLAKHIMHQHTIFDAAETRHKALLRSVQLMKDKTLFYKNSFEE